MELTDNERLMLVGKKEEIRKLTEEIIDLTADLKKNKTEIKKKVEGILSLISILASYAKPNFDMRPFMGFAQHTFYLMDSKPLFPKSVTTQLEILCNVANSMTFNFTKSGLKINIEKIDLSLIKAK